MIALGMSIGLNHPEFVAYRHRLLSSGKKPMVATVALAHRAHRLAFAMIRSQVSYDDQRWSASVAKGQPVRTTEVTTAT